jgi:hypothetical protein
VEVRRVVVDAGEGRRDEAGDAERGDAVVADLERIRHIESG